MIGMPRATLATNFNKGKKRNKMKNFIAVFVLILIFFSCTKRCRVESKYKDSIVVFFRPIFSSKTVKAHELINMSNCVPVNDTIKISHRDYCKISNFIQNKRYVKSKIKGVPEIYFKNDGKEIFLTLFDSLATDIKGENLESNINIVYLINKYCKFYNYYTKEEVMWGSLYRKYPFPKDYHYYYGYFTKRKQSDALVAIKKKGIKLWLVEKER